MKTLAFSVHDSKAQAFLPPFFLPTAGMAIRIFRDCVNSKDHQFGKHPADYTLFELGTFDDHSGVMDAYSAPISRGNGVEHREEVLVPAAQTDWVASADKPPGDSAVKSVNERMRELVAPVVQKLTTGGAR